MSTITLRRDHECHVDMTVTGWKKGRKMQAMILFERSFPGENESRDVFMVRLTVDQVRWLIENLADETKIDLNDYAGG